MARRYRMAWGGSSTHGVDLLRCVAGTAARNMMLDRA